MLDSLYIIDGRHRNEQDRAHRYALMLLRQGHTLSDVVIYLRTVYKDLWYKWRVAETRAIGKWDSRNAERKSFRTELDA